MSDLVEMLTIEDLTGAELDLAETVGIEAFKNLVRVYGGTSGLYIPKADRIVIPIRDTLIRREYNGDNAAELAVKWNLTERYIQEKVKEQSKQIKEMRSQPPKEQLRFF